MAPTARRKRTKGSGGVFAVRDGVWRVDVEVARTPSGDRRRVSRTVYGSRSEAELMLAALLADPTHQTEVFGVRLPVGMAERLRERAAADGVSVAEEIRRAVAEWIGGER